MGLSNAGPSPHYLFSVEGQWWTVEGPITHKGDIHPKEITPEYIKLSSQRTTASNTLKRKMVVEDGEEIISAPKILKNAESVKEQTQERRGRDDKTVVRAQLFGLFAEQEKWLFRELVKVTKQPDAWLKEILSEIADVAKRGPEKGLWELKPYLKNQKPST